MKNAKNLFKRSAAFVLSMIFCLGSMVIDKGFVFAEDDNMPKYSTEDILEGKVTKNNEYGYINLGYTVSQPNGQNERHLVGDVITFSAKVSFNSINGSFKNQKLIMTIPEDIKVSKDEIETSNSTNSDYKMTLEEIDGKNVVVADFGYYGTAGNINIQWNGSFNTEITEINDIVRESTIFAYGEEINADTLVNTPYLDTKEVEVLPIGDFGITVEKTLLNNGEPIVYVNPNDDEDKYYALSYEINIIRNIKVKEKGAVLIESATITDPLPSTVQGKKPYRFTYDYNDYKGSIDSENENYNDAIFDSSKFFDLTTDDFTTVNDANVGATYELKTPITITAYYKADQFMKETSTSKPDTMENIVTAKAKFIGGEESSEVTARADYEVKMSLDNYVVGIELTKEPAKTFSIDDLKNKNINLEFPISVKNTSMGRIDEIIIEDKELVFTNKDKGIISGVDYSFKEVSIPVFDTKDIREVVVQDENGNNINKEQNGNYLVSNGFKIILKGVAEGYEAKDIKIIATLTQRPIPIKDGKIDESMIIRNVNNIAYGTYNHNKGEVNYTNVNEPEKAEATVPVSYVPPTVTLTKEIVSANKNIDLENLKSTVLNYKITIKNTSNVTIDKITLEDMGLNINEELYSFVNAINGSGGGNVDSHKITINEEHTEFGVELINLKPNGEFIINATAKIKEIVDNSQLENITEINNVANITSEYSDYIFTATANDKYTINSKAGIGLTKETKDSNIALVENPKDDVLGGLLYENKTIDYKMVVTNSGQKKLNYTLEDIGLTFKDADGVIEGKYEFDKDSLKILGVDQSGYTFTLAPNNKSFTIVFNEMPAKAEYTINISAKIFKLEKEDKIPTKIINTAKNSAVVGNETVTGSEATATTNVIAGSAGGTITKGFTDPKYKDINDIYSFTEANYSLTASLNTNIPLERLEITDLGLFSGAKDAVLGNIETPLPFSIGYIDSIEIPAVFIKQLEDASTGKIEVIYFLENSTTGNSVEIERGKNKVVEIKDKGKITSFKVVVNAIKSSVAQYNFNGDSGIKVTAKFNPEEIIKQLGSKGASIANKAKIEWFFYDGTWWTGKIPEVSGGVTKIPEYKAEVELTKADDKDSINYSDIKGTGSEVNYTLGMTNKSMAVKEAYVVDTGIVSFDNDSDKTNDSKRQVGYSFKDITITADKVDNIEAYLYYFTDVLSVANAMPTLIDNQKIKGEYDDGKFTFADVSSKDIKSFVILFKSTGNGELDLVPAGYKATVNVKATIIDKSNNVELAYVTKLTNSAFPGWKKASDNSTEFGILRDATVDLKKKVDATITKTVEKVEVNTETNNNKELILDNLYDSTKENVITYKITIQNNSDEEGKLVLSDKDIKFSELAGEFTFEKVEFEDGSQEGIFIPIDKKSFTATIEHFGKKEIASFIVTVKVGKLVYTNESIVLTKVLNSATATLNMGSEPKKVIDASAEVKITNNNIAYINHDLSKTADPDEVNIVGIRRNNVDIDYIIKNVGHTSLSQGALFNYSLKDSGLTLTNIKGETITSSENSDEIWIKEIIFPALPDGAFDLSNPIKVYINGVYNNDWGKDGLTITSSGSLIIKTFEVKSDKVNSLFKGITINLKATIDKKVADTIFDGVKATDTKTKVGELVNKVQQTAETTKVNGVKVDSGEKSATTKIVSSKNPLFNVTKTNNIVGVATKEYEKTTWFYGNNDQRTIQYTINNIYNDSDQSLDTVKITDDGMVINLKDSQTSHDFNIKKFKLTYEYDKALPSDFSVNVKIGNVTKVVEFNNKTFTIDTEAKSFIIDIKNMPAGLKLIPVIDVELENVKTFEDLADYINITNKGTLVYTVPNKSEEEKTFSDVILVKDSKQEPTITKKIKSEVKDKGFVESATYKEEEVVEWQITIANDTKDSQKVSALLNPKIVDDLPEGYFPNLTKVEEQQKIEFGKNGNYSNMDSKNYTTDVDGTNHKITWNFDGTVLKYGESIRVTFKTTIVKYADPGIVKNWATVSFDNAEDKKDDAELIVKVIRRFTIKGEALGELDNNTTQTPNVSFSKPGGEASFNVTFSNYKEASINNIRLVDSLPFVNDKGITVTSDRGSKWSPEFASISEVIFAGKVVFPTIYVSKETKASVISGFLNGGQVDTNIWVPYVEDMENISEYKSIAFDFGNNAYLESSQKITFDIKVKLPDYSSPVWTTSGDLKNVAWNTVAASVDGDPTYVEGLKAGLGAKFAEIGDRVWYDRDNVFYQRKNIFGGYSDKGRPDVDVYLFETDENGNILNDNNPVAKRTTDANGIYSFSKVPIGYYKVGFVTPVDGAFTQHKTDNEENNSDVTVTQDMSFTFEGALITANIGLTRLVSLPDGGKDFNVDAGTIEPVRVTITKNLFSATNTNIPLDREFVFRVTSDAGYDQQVTLNAANASKTLLLQIGKYKIQEITTGYKTEIDVDGVKVNGLVSDFEVVHPDSPIAITVNNTIIPDNEIPEITVEKHLFNANGLELSLVNFNFDFEIVDNTGRIVDSFILGAGGASSHTRDLEIGEYTIREVGLDTARYKTSISVNGNLVDGASAQFNLENADDRITIIVNNFISGNTPGGETPGGNTPNTPNTANTPTNTPIVPPLPANFVPTAVDDVFANLDDEGTPLGYVKPELVGEDPSNPDDWEYILVDEEGIPLGKVNPKTADMSQTYMYISGLFFVIGILINVKLEYDKRNKLKTTA